MLATTSTLITWHYFAFATIFFGFIAWRRASSLLQIIKIHLDTAKDTVQAVRPKSSVKRSKWKFLFSLLSGGSKVVTGVTILKGMALRVVFLSILTFMALLGMVISYAVS